MGFMTTITTQVNGFEFVFERPSIDFRSQIALNVNNNALKCSDYDNSRYKSVGIKYSTLVGENHHSFCK